MSSYKRFLACADNHGSLISNEAREKLLGFSDSFKPHYRIHLGDVWDFSPLRKGASQEERSEGISQDYRDGMRFLSDFKPNYLTLGNHDARIWSLAENCADGILRETCADLVVQTERELRKRRIEFIPYKVGHFLRMPEGGPKLIHGFRSSQVSPAKLHHQDWGSCLHGHVHKVDEYTATHADGGQSFSVGCMADIDLLSYAERHTARMGWRNGFLYGIINTKTGSWNAWSVKKEMGDWISPLGVL